MSWFSGGDASRLATAKSSLLLQIKGNTCKCHGPTWSSWYILWEKWHLDLAGSSGDSHEAQKDPSSGNPTFKLELHSLWNKTANWTTKQLSKIGSPCSYQIAQQLNNLHQSGKVT
jgi:hypothetical protein